jgi:hypothetical protein
MAGAPYRRLPEAEGKRALRSVRRDNARLETAENLEHTASPRRYWSEPMAYVIHCRNLTPDHREWKWPAIEDRSTALQQACDLEAKQKCEVQRIVRDDGTEIPRADIDLYCKTRYRR